MTNDIVLFTSNCKQECEFVFSCLNEYTQSSKFNLDKLIYDNTILYKIVFHHPTGYSNELFRISSNDFMNLCLHFKHAYHKINSQIEILEKSNERLRKHNEELILELQKLRYIKNREGNHKLQESTKETTIIHVNTEDECLALTQLLNDKYSRLFYSSPIKAREKRFKICILESSGEYNYVTSIIEYANIILKSYRCAKEILENKKKS